jgi:NADH dehydrogenase
MPALPGPAPRNAFITGGTGYVGRALIPPLLERGHQVRALVRQGSVKKLPQVCEPVIGNALDASSCADRVQPSDTFVQLVGVPQPSPVMKAYHADRTDSSRIACKTSTTSQ